MKNCFGCCGNGASSSVFSRFVCGQDHPLNQYDATEVSTLTRRWCRGAGRLLEECPGSGEMAPIGSQVPDRHPKDISPPQYGMGQKYLSRGVHSVENLGIVGVGFRERATGVVPETDDRKRVRSLDPQPDAASLRTQPANSCAIAQ